MERIARNFARFEEGLEDIFVGNSGDSLQFLSTLNNILDYLLKFKT